jgi:transposase
MTETDPSTEDDSLTRSRAVDRVAEAIQTGIVRYALRRGEHLPPTWDELTQQGQNRLRAAVVALATIDRPALVTLLDLIHE